MKHTNQVGFTLIETVVVITVFGIISSIALVALVNILRASSKTTVLNSVRQNGDYALAQIVRTVHTAVSIQSPTLPCNSSSSPTSANPFTITAADGTTATYTCTSSSPKTITYNGNSLFDTNAVTMTSCNVTCSQETQSDNPVITIDFFLKSNSTSNLAEKTAPPVEFQTTVIMRNIGR